MPAVAAGAAVWAASTAGAFTAVAATWGVAGTVIASAVVGAVAGGATAAIMGKDIGKGALVGAMSGGVTGGLIGATGGAAAQTPTSAASGGTSAATGSTGSVAANTGTALLDKAPSAFWEAAVKGGTASGGMGQQASTGLIGTAMQIKDNVVSPDVQAMIDANLKASRDATKWQMIGTAASKGLDAYMTEDPEDARRAELDAQLELERSRRIKLTPGFGEGIPTKKRFESTPFAKRLANIQEGGK